MSEPSFESKLSALCSKELSDAHGDPARMGAMIERLAHSLAFTVAIVGEGDRTRIDNLLTGLEGYIQEAAVGHAKMGAFMAVARAPRKP